MPRPPHSSRRRTQHQNPQQQQTKQQKAANTIAKYWRNRFAKNTTQKLVQRAYVQMHINIDHVKSISFQSLVEFLRQRPVIAAMKAALQRIHYLATFRHGSPSRSLAPENINVRVFLAAFMIAYRPTHVFENMGPLERDLFEAGVPLLSMFETICKTLLHAQHKHFQNVPANQTKDFPTTLFEYLRRFKAWKVPDEAKLIARISNALVALYEAHLHLPPDEPQDSDLNVEFRASIDRLRGKLEQIGGPEAIQKFDTDHPRASFLVSGGGGSQTSSTSTSAVMFPSRITNEQMAHELLVDPTFQLDDTYPMVLSSSSARRTSSRSELAVFHQMRTSFHRAFWNSLVDDLNLQVPCYVRVIRVLKEIRDGITDLAGSREPTIIEILDLDFIERRAEAQTYTIHDDMQLIASVYQVIKRVQAPIRDEQTTERWLALQNQQDQDQQSATQRICKGIEFLLECVNLMRIDASNSRLRLIAPVIREHGIDYEQRKFAEKLDDGTLTLQRTQAWFQHTITTQQQVVMSQQQQQQNNNNIIVDIITTPGEALRMHATAFASLITDRQQYPNAFSPTTVPETLLFDINRLNDFRQDFDLLVTKEVMLCVLAIRTRTDPPGLIQNTTAILDNMDDLFELADLHLPAPAEQHIAIELDPNSTIRKAITRQISNLL